MSDENSENTTMFDVQGRNEFYPIHQSSYFPSLLLRLCNYLCKGEIQSFIFYCFPRQICAVKYSIECRKANRIGTNEQIHACS